MCDLQSVWALLSWISMKLCWLNHRRKRWTVALENIWFLDKKVTVAMKIFEKEVEGKSKHFSTRALFSHLLCLIDNIFLKLIQYWLRALLPAAAKWAAMCTVNVRPLKMLNLAQIVIRNVWQYSGKDPTQKNVFIFTFHLIQSALFCWLHFVNYIAVHLVAAGWSTFTQYWTSFFLNCCTGHLNTRYSSFSKN